MAISTDWWKVEAIGTNGAICTVIVEENESAAEEFVAYELRKRVFGSEEPWFEKNVRTGKWERVLDYVASPYDEAEDP